MIVIKAGGSAITDKSQPYTMRIEVMQAVANQLKDATEPVILAHGVGSFGHPLAKKYHITRGFDQTETNRLGFLYTHYWVDELSQRFIKILLDANIPVGRIHATSIFVTEKRRIVTFFDEPLRRYLDLGIIPVLHGDGPTDRSQGFCVLSADQTVVYLARHFGATRVIFGIDVDGILQEGQTVPHLKYQDLTRWQKIIADNKDASGGLPMKLKEIEALAGSGIPVHLINLTRPGTLAATLQGEAVGTIITD